MAAASGIVGRLALVALTLVSLTAGGLYIYVSRGVSDVFCLMSFHKIVVKTKLIMQFSVQRACDSIGLTVATGELSRDACSSTIALHCCLAYV